MLESATGPKEKGHTLWTRQDKNSPNSGYTMHGQREKKEKIELQNNIAQLQLQNNQMLEKINQLLKELGKSNDSNLLTQQEFEYFTDEEELAIEIEWVFVERKKRNNKKSKVN